MSESAFLICSCNRIGWGLGKPLREADGLVARFSETPGETPSEKSAVLWKVFADHAGHRLRVAPDWDEQVHEQMSTVLLPAMLDEDVTYEQFLAGWPEAGFDELAEAGFEVRGEGFLVCAECGERLPLGRPVLDRESAVLFFHSGGKGAAPNSHQADVSDAAWRFLAEHYGHSLRAEVDGLG
ncbi:hypothetical protein [Symbioplanes lichenis]|uniref:hypothetical protein n=1 Tax=Symbioplanes lichenis TaxID=1629072 RepID=UPI002738BA96|nr:hypothetical protein [Actinoplanes lichenis]